MSPATRGDALADAVAAWQAADDAVDALSGKSVPPAMWTALEDSLKALRAALATYRASQVEGERVRLAVFDVGDPVKGQQAFSESLMGYLNPHPRCYVEFTLPPRTTPPTVDAEVVQ